LDCLCKENCGLCGVYGTKEAALKTFYGLYALQHRGQESAGIVSTDGRDFREYRSMGLVAEVFSRRILEKLENPVAIGHVRYSTTGSSSILNAQPFVAKYLGGKIAVAHNGNLVNAANLRHEFESNGSIFQTTMDTEIIVHLMAKLNHLSKQDQLLYCLKHLKGAFSLLILTSNEMIGVRDKNGWRPLILGRVDGGYCLASETTVFDLIGAKFVREVEPGEVIVIDDNGTRSLRYCSEEEISPSYCIFEHIYFARPDSNIFGDNNHKFRMRLGSALAREHPVCADIVIAVPDSGSSAALGYSLASGIPLDHGFVRNHYIGRTFIQPQQSMRDLSVEIKLNVNRTVVAGKRVIVVDDSLIRGTTSRKRINSLRQAGAKEVHMRISCMPTKFPCYFGIDFPDPKELIANRMSIEEIRKHLNLDSLAYQSEEGMLSVVKHPKKHYCTACFTGRYPIPVNEPLDKLAMERV